MSGKQDKGLPVGGGLHAVRYVLAAARETGAGRLSAAVRSRNTCKACAFGTGGQRGGLHNESRSGIEICNKNIQAQMGDMRPGIPPELFSKTSIADLRTLSGRELEALGRLQHPLYKEAGASHYRIIHMDEAIGLAARRLRQSSPERSFFYSSGRSSNEAAFLLQLFARAFGCNHVNNCSYYCHQASGVGLQNTIGTGTATIRYDDLQHADLIFVMGANPASNHPRFVKTLIDCRRRGGQVIVINPAREPGLLRFASPANFRSMILGGVEIASLYVQPHIGGDLALLQAIARKVLFDGDPDLDFITTYCKGFSCYQEHLENLNPKTLVTESGVDQETIDRIAEIYSRSSATVFAWGMGLTHHRSGVDNIEAVSNLALLRGMLGGPGKGLLPLRGHSNVQGVGSMGVTPALKEQVLRSMETELGIVMPRHQGMDTLACLQAAAAGKIDFALLQGGNLFAASPDSAFAESALDAIGCKLMLTSSLNLGHTHGVEGENLILPIRVRDEESQPTTQESMFNYVRLSDGGIDRFPPLLAETDIISALASQVIPRETLDFSLFGKHRHIREAIARIIPGFEQLGSIDETRNEFHIPGRHLERKVFATPDGKAHFRLPSSLQQAPGPEGSYRLTSVRSEGQFNTIIYTDEDVYRGQTGRDIVMMSPEDMLREGLQEDDPVELYTDKARMSGLRVRPFALRPGNLMTYFPEANVLVPQTIDLRSRTPAFKHVTVRLRRME